MVAEKSEYSIMPAGYARVAVDLRIENRSDQPAMLFLCAFDVERDAGEGFETVIFSGCTEAATLGPTIAPHADRVVSFARGLDVKLVDEKAQYRVTTPIFLGPDFKHGMVLKSVPFTLVRSK